MDKKDCYASQYQRILLSEDTNNRVNTRRQCLIQMVKASPENLSNMETCNLLESKLKRYSNCILSHSNENTYNTKLLDLLNSSSKIIETPRNFKTNLNEINAKTLIDPLTCSNKNHCNISETFNESEFSEFVDHLFNKTQESQTRTKATDNIDCAQNKSNMKNYMSCFKTAREELQIQNTKKYGNSSCLPTISANGTGQKRKLGTRRNMNSKFVSPLLSNNDSQEEIKSGEWPMEVVDSRLKNIEPKMIELIKSEIMDCGPNIHWNDIAGLSFAKIAIQEAVIWPMLRPDIFTGLRRPPKGILLFGPPGTGKTLIGKCVASQSKSTFFSISASSLTSKWIGDGEKMVRTLFTVARVHQPAVIFLDEIDSLLTQRSDTENECTRRIKTEFLVQLDGATVDSDERLLVIGATNRPQELDEAARRRFVKRLYIPLPEYEGRLQLVRQLISKENHELNEEDFKEIAMLSEGYSGADIKTLCSEASLGPIRSIDFNRIEHIQATEVRPLLMEDFFKAFARVKSSVAPKDLEQYIEWDKIYGSGNGV